MILMKGCWKSVLLIKKCLLIQSLYFVSKEGFSLCIISRVVIFLMCVCVCVHLAVCELLILELEGWWWWRVAGWWWCGDMSPFFHAIFKRDLLRRHGNLRTH